MNKKMLKMLALVTALTTAVTLGITHIDDFKDQDIIEYLNEPEITTSQDYQTDSTTDNHEKETIVESTQSNIEITKPEEIDDNRLAYATADVNLRSSTSTDSFKIGKLEIGDSAIKILSDANGWDLVNFNGTLGYVYRDYIEYTDSQIDDGYIHIAKDDIVLTNTDLNFRSAPSASSDKMDTLEENTELQVLAEVDNGWLLVRYNGTLGYVSGEYTTSLLDKLNTQYPNLSLDSLEIQKVVYNNATQLNLRKEPNTDCEILNELERYETLRVLKETDEWSLVMTNDYQFGYVFKEYTKDITGIFVDVDKSEQRLTLYNDNEVMLQTPVTTGKDSTPSDTGYFSIYSKETNRYLVGDGYKSFVEYWMPYNGGEGLHDASWRSVFGTESYHTSGSHGCINMPTDIADDVYNNVEVGTKVLVHK